MASVGKTLIAFDFDHTIVDGNTDTHIRSMHSGKLPEAISHLYSSSGWIEYMAAIFDLLHSNSVSIDDMREKLHELPLTKGMDKLFEYLLASMDKYECVIISDSNTLFIRWLVEKHGIEAAFDKVYTNPAVIDGEGRLKLDYFHNQDWCTLSSRNLCKGHILDDHLKQRKKQGVCFNRVVYVGDGHNDLCPSLRLKKDDVVFPREGHSLIKQIKENANQVKANVIPWNCATTILNYL